MMHRNDYLKPLEIIQWQTRVKSAEEVASINTGPASSKLMVIVETPDAHDDQQRDVANRADQLLTAMLQSISIKREDAVIIPILECHPDAEAEKIARARTFLNEQIQAHQPTLILVTGHLTAQILLQNTQPMDSLRGVIHNHPETTIPLIVTYHPAHLLHTQSDKKKAYSDLKLTIKTLTTAL